LPGSGQKPENISNPSWHAFKEPESERILSVQGSCGNFLRRSTYVFLRMTKAIAPAGAATMLALLPCSSGLEAQIANRVPQSIDSARKVVLRNHHPQWAIAANSLGVVPTGEKLDQFTLVLARSAEQEQAFEQLLADQQNPASPEYHHWLTPAEVGQRFGVSDADIASIEGWLQSQGLHANWVSPSRNFLGFGGTAADVGRAFGTELRYYTVNGAQRMSVAGDPQIPQALAPVIGAVRGLYAVDEQPMVRTAAVQLSQPDATASNGSHFVTPADFSKIYNVPAAATGAGVTIGIVSWSRVNSADLDNFRSKTSTSFSNPTEVVPTAYGGIDPGPAYTTQQSCTHCLDGQMEATLDVQRAGSTAPGANILLVASSSSGSGGGIGAAAQYLVNTSPVPAQVMSISFGGCELSAGSSGVNYWNAIFQQAAAEGISVFVASGDSGASGCDNSFAAPPSVPQANSPNYICSSQYATCVGGTQFNDVSNPSTYWNSINGQGLLSALGYIPEGGWNESSTTSVAASGGGVSTVVPTPSWQTGIGVPTARAGRYTPDVSFTASAHDGYFGCLAASGATCVVVGSSFPFTAFAGTSASAPGMAGVAALLDQMIGSPQGNLNPALYGLAASNPAIFHDATAATSGIATCDVNTASICNNTIPTPTSMTTGTSGYALGTGFDQVTGLGSLDVTAFINSYTPTNPKTTPTVVVSPSSTSITTSQALTVGVTVSGGNGNPVPTGTVILASGTYTSSPVTLSNGTASINVAAGALSVGSDTLGVTYSPDAASSSLYNTATGSSTVSVTQPPPIASFTLSGTAITVTAGATSTSTITVTPVNGFTGPVTLTAVITSMPPGAANYPTLSFGATSPVNITSSSSGTATLSVTTTASQQGSCTASNETPRSLDWYGRGGGVLACVLLLGIRSRRRKFRATLGMMALLLVLASGVLACGGSKSTPCTPTTIAGTTAGNYTITVTGTSATATTSRTLTLTVQ
jgi:subtilase family serine protease